MYTESQEIISFFPHIYIHSSSIMLYTKLQTHTHSFASMFQYSLPKKFISFHMQSNTTQQVLYSKSRCPLFPVTTFRSSVRDPNSIDIRIQVRIFKSRFRLTFSSDPTLSTPPFFFKKKLFFPFSQHRFGGGGRGSGALPGDIISQD